MLAVVKRESGHWVGKRVRAASEPSASLEHSHFAARVSQLAGAGKPGDASADYCSPRRYGRPPFSLDSIRALAAIVSLRVLDSPISRLKTL